MGIRYVGSDLHQFVHHWHRTERKASWRGMLCSSQPPPSCRPASSLAFTLEWVKSCCSYNFILSPLSQKKKRKCWGLAAFHIARCGAKQRARDKQLLNEAGKEGSPAQRWVPHCSSRSWEDLGEAFLKRAGAQPEWIITRVASEHCWSH